jgi:hypothetical protein
MLSSAFAFNPIFGFFEAHSSAEFFSLDTADHSLMECVARMRLHID